MVLVEVTAHGFPVTSNECFYVAKDEHLEDIACGLIGHGKVAGLFARAVSTTTSAKIVAVCGRERDRAEPFGTEHGLEVFDDPADMVATTKAQLVIVATPHPTHARLAIDAMAAGANVLVEKPLATTTADCDAMISTAAESGVWLGTVSQRRFYPPVQRMYEAIRSGRIGTPALATLTIAGWRDNEYFESDPWRGTWSGEGGGVLVNQAVHHLDLLQWMFGPISEVFGYWTNVNHPEIEVDDSAVAVVRGPDGRLGTIFATNAVKPGLHARLQVHGSSGASVGVQTDGGAMFVAGVSEGVEAPFTDTWTIPGEEDRIDEFNRLDRAEFIHDDPIVRYHRLAVEDFVDAIVRNRPPSVTGPDGRRAVQLFQAIYRAHASGAVQHLDADF